MLVVGLGNPGATYKNTRHNVGFMVIDELTKKLSATKVSSLSFKGELYKYQNHFFLKPLTFMNLSGESVIRVKNFYKIDDVVVVHDDLDLPFGAVRFKFGGGNGGHNGLKSIDEKIGKEYARVRIGIGKPRYKTEVSSYVLSDFNEYEQKNLGDILLHASDAVEFLFSNSLDDTSSKYTIKKFKLQ